MVIAVITDDALAVLYFVPVLSTLGAFVALIVKLSGLD
jgi:hypothetical protein